jgi:uncharacterized protein YfaP (DUF2135 family)
MSPSRVASALAMAAAVLVAYSCKSDSTSPGGNVTCQSSDPVCPPANLSAGLSGPAGSPSIAPTSFAGTTVSVAASAFPVNGTTNATTNGYWLLVTGNTLRSWGVLAVSGGAFVGDIPLFCGAQTIALTFNNASGRAYYTATVTLSGCTTPAFRAQLTWDTGPSSDIDLHLLRPGGSMNTGNDCYYSNCQGTALEWGAVGAAGNPLLDVDDTEGYGPENIYIVSGAEPGEYRVVVHNYDDSPSTRATVKLFFNDVEAARYTSVALDSPNNRYWEVAKVQITTQQVTTVNTYSSTPPVAVGAAAAAAPVK